MPETNHVPQSPTGKGLAEVVQEYMDDLRRRFPRAECVLEEPGYGDEDIVVRVYGEPGELNALSSAAAQLSAEFDKRYDIFILALVSPLSDCPVRP
jgi:hypothetical protein